MHAENGLGGSVAKRTLNCPGWRHLAAVLPPLPSSSYADEGTRLHNIIAPLALQPPGSREDKGDGKIRQALEAYDVRWPWETRSNTRAETRVDLPIPGAFGTADILIEYPTRLVVCDWKFGDGVQIEAHDNDQLLFYCAGVLSTYPELRRPLIELAIVQPPHLRVWLVSDTVVDAWLERYRAALEEAHLCRGDWCRWCPVDAAGECPEPTALEALGQLLTQ